MGERFLFDRGEVVGLGVGDIDFSGVSVGDGVGERFFFWRGDPLGEGDGFFFGVGVGVTEGDAFGLGVGVGVGDFFFVSVELFLFRGFGVGVGVAKIFFSVWTKSGSAARAGAALERVHTIKTIIVRTNIKILTDCSLIS